MKNLLRTVALLLIVASTTIQNTFANNNLNSYVKTVEQVVMANPLEKVYLHMDNTSYFMGDTLWFKAYAVNAAQNKPTEESEILHVELLNPEGVIVRTQKYRLEGGKCAGSLPISKELLSGFFEIRAYTKAMLNFGYGNYFTRVFPVLEGTQQSPEILDRLRTVGYMSEKPSKKEIKQAEKEQGKVPHYNVRFYPEGGNMVVGIASKVAFQICNNEGELLAEKCRVVDSRGREIETQSTHLGIGTFEIIPNGGKCYMIIEGDKDKTKYELPEPIKSGAVIAVQNKGKGVEIAIASNMSEAFGIAIMGQGEMLLAKECTGNDRFIVDNSDLKEGVNQVVLYNNQGQEVASRLFFVKNNTQPQLTIASTRSGESQPHARQNIIFKVADNQGKGVATDFSLAIYDDATAEGTPQQSIYTSLLLSSELRGYIPNADYYFAADGADDAERTNNLDLVMMVHGWSRYRWDEMSGTTPTVMLFPYEKELSVYGRVFLHKWRSVATIVNTSNYPRQYKVSRVGSVSSSPTVESSPGSYYYYDVPTKNIFPYNDIIIMDHTSVFDNAIYKYKAPKVATQHFNNGEDNRFSLSYSDFTGALNVMLKPHDELMNKKRVNLDEKYTDSKYKKVFIADSEYRPQERLYNFYERSLASSVKTNAMSDYPAIKLRYYNRGRYSQFHLKYKSSLYESALNSRYTSIENYIEYYSNKKQLKKMHKDAPNGILESPSNATNEQLYYNKMPYGTVSHIATLSDTRNISGRSSAYTTSPLKNVYLNSKDISPSVFGSAGSAGAITIADYTIIHTSYEKRLEIYEKYKEDENFRVFSINHWRVAPKKASTKELPDYIVEYVGRIGSSNSISKYSSRQKTLPRAVILQGFEEGKREFYSPDYSAATPPTSGDHRRTLYWNPNVESDTQGNATVTFYNNSKGGSYTIDAQTITANGEIGTTMTTK